MGARGCVPATALGNRLSRDVQGAAPVTLIVIGQLGGGLIAADLKTNALPIYFARPITPLTYILGKWVTIGFFIAITMLLPNLLALAGGVLVAGAPGTWAQTLWLGGALTLTGAGVMLVGGLVILAISSLTEDRRFVMVGWLAVALLPHFTQQILYEHLDPQLTTGFLGSLSLSSDSVTLASWLLDLRAAWEATGCRRRPMRPRSDGSAAAVSALVLLGTTALAAAICYRRVVRFSRSGGQRVAEVRRQPWRSSSSRAFRSGTAR